MTLSQDLFQRAKKVIPGGVNSPVRAFSGVDGEPIFFQHASGAHLFDVDNHRYIDYVGSWGPMIVGHSHPKVIQAVQEAASQGLSFGAPTKLEVELAEQVTRLMPNIEMLRMVNSGTEATMTAIRLARGFTGRDKILKFAGCYHGHSDSLLVKAGSGLLTLGIPSSPGVPASIAEQTITAPFNDLTAVEQIFENHGNEIAAIIIEPISGNMGCILPEPTFLIGLRDICNHHRSVLIFDEVMTGFRVALGGAQAHYNVKPDLTTLGKIIGGGMPVGAIGGSRAIMEQLAPLGPIYQAGTLSGNPVAMAAGLATLQLISQPNFFDSLKIKTQQLVYGILERAQAANIALSANQIGGMFGLFFTKEEKVSNFQQVQQCDITAFKTFFHAMLTQGIYLAPSAYEAGFVSSAHSEQDIQHTLDACENSFKEMDKQ